MKVDFERGDYHMHTCCSDGTHTPQEIVDWAVGRSLKEIAITDHDGVAGIELAREYAKAKAKEDERYDINIIAGIEFSSVLERSLVGMPNLEDEDKVDLHILGYHLDLRNKRLNDTCQRIMVSRRERNVRLVQALRDADIDISYEELVAEKKKKTDNLFIGKPDMGRLMANKGYVKDLDDAFEKFFDNSPYRQMRKMRIESKDAIETIKEAGGQAVLAHPGKIRGIGLKGSETFKTNFENILKELIKEGLEGLECYHPSHREEDVKMFLAYAKEYGLFPTKGSDFHGD